MLRYAKGKKAIERILDRVGERTNLVVHHKEYALATKFFEYGFEPLISEVNSVLYAVNFHKFIGNLFYMNLLLKNPRALDLSQRFEEAVRTDDSRLRDLLSIHSPDERHPVELLISFGVYNRNAILRELAQVKSFGGWILELTLTSLWSLLTHWGDRADSLHVYCDQSVPLHDEQDYVNLMVGRLELTRSRSISGSAKSRSCSTLQVRSSWSILLAHLEFNWLTFSPPRRCTRSRIPGRNWSRNAFGRMLVMGAINDDCVYPDLDHVDFRKPEVIVNFLIFLELLERSRKGESLTNGIDVFIRTAYENLPKMAREMPQIDMAAGGNAVPLPPRIDMHALSLLRVHSKRLNDGS